MQRNRAFFIAGVCAALLPRLAHAGAPPGTCALGTPERAAAARDLDAIDTAVETLGIAADPAPLTARIEALAESPCLGTMDDAFEPPSSGLALKTYWEAGGSARVHAYLSMGDPGARTLWIAPAMRRALTLETNPRSSIRELLCPFADAACGASTRGWALRAQHEFEVMAKPPPDRDDDCRKHASEAEPAARFDEYRQCELTQRTPRAALPIGTTRALDHGWLIVEGRRGHYDFCDEVRAYDLATGSAYRVASCSGLALRTGGSVDFRATDAHRQSIVELGNVPIAALREAAWMLLLLDEIDRNVFEGFGVSLPESIPISVDGAGSLQGFGMSFHFTSADTQLAWRVDGANSKPLKSGSLTWPPSPLDDAPAEHAATLLRVAEAELMLGCPSAPPPASVLCRDAALSASGLDADHGSLSAAARSLQARWREASALQRQCRAKSSVQ